MEKSKLKIAELREAKKRPLILDGAMGSLLTERKFQIDENLWSSMLNLTNPEAVQQIHKEYIEAGAEIITTNTFRTNPSSFSRAEVNMKNEELVRLSVFNAIEARGTKEILIAGSNAPAEDCYQRGRTLSHAALEENHHQHLSFLRESGCDLILNETQSHLDEIMIICKFCDDNSIPYIMSLYFDSEYRLLSGEPVADVVDYILEYSPEAIGFNCIKEKMLSGLIKFFIPPANWGFYLNCCIGEVEDGDYSCGIETDSFLNEIRPFLDLKPLFTGACCGSNPSHIKALKDFFDEIYRN